MRPNGKLSLISTCEDMSLLAMVVLGSIVAVAQEHNASRRYKQVNLVSDIAGLAAVTDPSLVNPWGVAFSPTSPFWVSDNGTGVATLYNGTNPFNCDHSSAFRQHGHVYTYGDRV